MISKRYFSHKNELFSIHILSQQMENLYLVRLMIGKRTEWLDEDEDKYLLFTSTSSFELYEKISTNNEFRKIFYDNDEKHPTPFIVSYVYHGRLYIEISGWCTLCDKYVECREEYDVYKCNEDKSRYDCGHLKDHLPTEEEWIKIAQNSIGKRIVITKLEDLEIL